MKLIARLTLAAGCVFNFLSIVAAAERTNVVYIMADELGYYELSCMGNPNIRTPRIDQMASEGMRFTQALAGSSVCAPTRCCLMTGKHSGHTSVRSNGGGTPLRAGEPTVASILKAAGYATGGFGKWGVRRPRFDRCSRRAWLRCLLRLLRSGPRPYLLSALPGPQQRGSSAEEQPRRSDGETYSHYVIHEAAIKFIRDNKDQPFFCYLPITPPHGMFDIPDSDPAWQLYKDKPWPDQAKRYAAMVTMVDRQVRRSSGPAARIGTRRQHDRLLQRRQRR